MDEADHFRRSIVEWLTDNDGGEPMACPLCKEAYWSVGTTGNLPASGLGVAHPLVPLICKTCGLTMFFSLAFIQEQREKEAQEALQQADIDLWNEDQP